MMQIVEYVRSYSQALLRKMGAQVTEPLHNETLRRGRRLLWVERRRETRSPRMSPCTYGLMRSVDHDGVMLEEGQGTATNESLTGIRLLLGLAPPKGKLLEIQINHAIFRGGVYLAEVCWTKPLREEAQGVLYLVGCRLKFVTMHSQAI